MPIRPNRVKQKLATGEPVCVVGGTDSADVIDQIGPLGLDGVWLESEHGAVDFADVSDLTRACDLWGMTSILRINQNEQSIIYRALDRGVQGICVPHVNTQAEALNVVAGAKYAPIGQRGMYSCRQAYDVPDYIQVANDHTFVMILIEDIVALENLDEILEVDHIDVFYVAPHDLAASMGHIGDVEHPDVKQAVDDSLAKIHDRKRVSGTLVTNDNASAYVDAGVRFLFTMMGLWINAGATDFLKSTGR